MNFTWPTYTAAIQLMCFFANKCMRVRMATKNLVFVYGTLKTNEPNHPVILTDPSTTSVVLDPIVKDWLLVGKTGTRFASLLLWTCC